jgi:hypothetical protein
MTSFVNEAGNTVGVEKSFISYQAHLWKVGAAAGWTSSQLPLNLPKGRYKIEVEIVESASNSIRHLCLL